MPAYRLLLAAGLALAANHADAADIDILDAPEIVAIAPTAGWYLRADLAYGFEASYGGSQNVLGAAAITDRYGAIDLEDGIGGGVGIGYKANDWLRFDATVDYWNRDVEARNGAGWFCGFDGSCGSKERGDVEAVEVLANAYLDLGTVAGFTPYLGAGVGAVHVDYGDGLASAYCHGAVPCAVSGAQATYGGESSWRFAYAASAGVSYDVSEKLSVDVGYRYLNVEEGDAYRLDTGSGTAILGEDDGFDRHTVRAGLRFKLW